MTTRTSPRIKWTRLLGTSDNDGADPLTTGTDGAIDMGVYQIQPRRADLQRRRRCLPIEVRDTTSPEPSILHGIRFSQRRQLRQHYRHRSSHAECCIHSSGEGANQLLRYGFRGNRLQQRCNYDHDRCKTDRGQRYLFRGRRHHPNTVGFSSARSET